MRAKQRTLHATRNFGSPWTQTFTLIKIYAKSCLSLHTTEYVKKKKKNLGLLPFLDRKTNQKELY